MYQILWILTFWLLPNWTCLIIFIIMNSFLHCVNLLKWGSLFGELVQGLSSWQTKLQVGFFFFFFPIMNFEYFLYVEFLYSLKTHSPQDCCEFEMSDNASRTENRRTGASWRPGLHCTSKFLWQSGDT